MIYDEQTIIKAYNDAARKEVYLHELERQMRVLSALVTTARADSSRARDRITQIHRGLSEIVLPYEDHEESVTRLSGARV